jgi:hypothetical protein
LKPAAAFVICLLGVFAFPVAAHASYENIVNNESAWCLESNQAGDVYINPCQPGNDRQMWERWNAGWTRNVATGLCLRGDGHFNAASIHTAPCTWNEPRLNWLHWHGGWYQRASFDAQGFMTPPECLSRLVGSEHDITGVECKNPLGPNPPREEWYAVEATSLSPPPPPPPPPPPAPPAEPCEPSPGESGLRLRVRFRRSGRVATASYGRRLRVHGRLVTADGAPVANATFCVGTQSSARAPVRAAASIVADARGRFSYMLRPGPSRRVWFVHRAGGTSVAASVLVRVRAPVTLRASPRSLRNGQAVTLRGRLGGQARARGLLVVLQARGDKGWITFATTRTSRRGRFQYSYQFTGTVGVHTYGMRARVPAQRGSAFAAGASQVVRVRVVG